MRDESPKHNERAMHDLRPGMLGADDHKIRQILAVVDAAADPSVNQTLLDTLRPRLALLKPARPLRFARLLLMPLDPLTIQARFWRPGEPAIPRPVLAPIAAIARAGLGDEAHAIDRMIAGHKTDATQMITHAGDLLWPRAAEILAAAGPPPDWQETGLPFTLFPSLAAGIAAVLRRAAGLRNVALCEELGALPTDAEAVEDIARAVAEEPELGRAMIARLLLVRSPRAATYLRGAVASWPDQDDKAAVGRALERGTEAVLLDMEHSTGFVDAIGRGALAGVGDEVRRIATLLREIEQAPPSAPHLRRLNAIRDKLSGICRERFARGVSEGLVVPLATANAPVDGRGQTELEICARDLRKLDLAARPLGGPAEYERLLAQALNAVRLASTGGTLTPIRHCRLIEILAGSDAAESLYAKAPAEA
jgi:hypothetical protein